MSVASRIYWDSCVAIYRVEQVAPWFERIDRRLLELANDACLCLSDLTWMECRVGPMSTGNAQLLARYDEFFSRPEVVWLPMAREVFARASQLRAVHHVKTPDALHLATALVGECDEFWTHDDRLAEAASSHLRVVGLDDKP